MNEQEQELYKQIKYNTGAYDDDARSCAEIIYEMGYRKQIEAEWIKIDAPLAETKYVCSSCNFNVVSWYGEHDEYIRERSVFMMRYCPNCGARMKGGNS